MFKQIHTVLRCLHAAVTWSKPRVLIWFFIHNCAIPTVLWFWQRETQFNELKKAVPCPDNTANESRPRISLGTIFLCFFLIGCLWQNLTQSWLLVKPSAIFTKTLNSLRIKRVNHSYGWWQSFDDYLFFQVGAKTLVYGEIGLNMSPHQPNCPGVKLPSIMRLIPIHQNPKRCGMPSSLSSSLHYFPSVLNSCHHGYS